MKIIVVCTIADWRIYSKGLLSGVSSHDATALLGQDCTPEILCTDATADHAGRQAGRQAGKAPLRRYEIKATVCAAHRSHKDVIKASKCSCWYTTSAPMITSGCICSSCNWLPHAYSRTCTGKQTERCCRARMQIDQDSLESSLTQVTHRVQAWVAVCKYFLWKIGSGGLAYDAVGAGN